MPVQVVQMSYDEQGKQAATRHEGEGRSAPYPLSRMAPTIELVDLAREIAAADNMLTTLAHGKLQVIADQIRALRDEAHAILEQTRRDQELHRAACNFKRVPGRVYHLYRRSNGALYFSMLAPAEWGEPPDSFVGSFRLENDMSWVPADKAEERPDTRQLLRQLLQE